jgi:hypothetical protein
MYGLHVGKLSVEKASSVFYQPRWTTTGGKGYEWYYAQVNLQSSIGNLQQFDVCVIFFNLQKLIKFVFRLLLKEHGQEIIVIQLLLMILYFLMIYVELPLINVILILMIQFVV